MSEPTSQDLKTQIDALKSTPAGTETPAPAAPDKPATTPAPVQPGQVPTPEPQKGQPAPGTPSTPSVQIVTPPAEKVTFEQLKAKTGIPDADALAASFQEAQRKITEQAEALKKLKTPESATPPVTPEKPTPAPVDKEALKARFLEDLANDAPGTIARLVSAIVDAKNEPLMEERKNTLLQKEVIKLATSPDTATTFNDQQVHDEMKKVAEENPEFLSDLPKNLKKIHDMALGRLVGRGIVISVKPQIPGSEPVPEVGKNKPPAPQAPFDPSKASAAELAEHIKQLSSKG